jgi:hypothetical protein
MRNKLRGPEIAERALHNLWIVVQHSDPRVALVAEQSANGSRDVAVIHSENPMLFSSTGYCWWISANSTQTFLSGIEKIISIIRNLVLALERRVTARASFLLSRHPALRFNAQSLTVANVPSGTSGSAFSFRAFLHLISPNRLLSLFRFFVAYLRESVAAISDRCRPPCVSTCTNTLFAGRMESCGRCLMGIKFIPRLTFPTLVALFLEYSGLSHCEFSLSENDLWLGSVRRLPRLFGPFVFYHRGECAC